MTAPAKPPAALPDKGPFQVNPSPEQHRAVEFVKELFEPKYSSKGKVLDDYSLNQCVELLRRHEEIASGSGSVAQATAGAGS